MFPLTFLIILLAAVFGSSLMVALIAYVHHRLGKLESGAQGNDRVLTELESLRDQLDSTTSY